MNKNKMIRLYNEWKEAKKRKDKHLTIITLMTVFIGSVGIFITTFVSSIVLYHLYVPIWAIIIFGIFEAYAIVWLSVICQAGMISVDEKMFHVDAIERTALSTYADYIRKETEDLFTEFKTIFDIELNKEVKK